MRTDVYSHVSCIALHDIIVDHVDVCKALQSTTGLDIVLPGRRRRKKKSTAFPNDTKGVYSFEMTASILEDKELLCAF